MPCLTDAFDTRVAGCSARLIEAAGMAPLELPAGQTCCGQALRNAGLVRDGDRLARRMAKVFAANDAVVTPSASCAAHVRLHGPPELAAKTFELAEFLVRHGFDPAERECRWAGRVAVHPSCHGRGLAAAARDGGGADPTLALLARVADLELVPLPREASAAASAGRSRRRSRRCRWRSARTSSRRPTRPA
ncbi:MAG: (Fe-S)-binding protein [Myxococcota bacterium]